MRISNGVEGNELGLHMVLPYQDSRRRRSSPLISQISSTNSRKRW